MNAVVVKNETVEHPNILTRGNAGKEFTGT